MREILFRGKRLDNGEWIEGFYVCLCNDLHYILTGKLDLTKHCVMFEKHAVIPETIGQYTGLTDKNGKKIFEGDILSEKPPMNNEEYIGYVVYDEEATVCKCMFLNGKTFNGVILGSYSKSYTVIGNKFDNPELLRSDTE